VSTSAPRHPHEVLFAKLSQAMSAPGAVVRHDLGPKAAAAAGVGDRIEWIPVALRAAPARFQFPGGITAADQVIDYEVTIHGSSFARMLELHAQLAATLENLIGPEGGSPPSDDAAPATLTGAVDLTTFSYPFSGLIGTTLNVLADGLARALSLPSSPVASPRAIVDALNMASNAVPAAGMSGALRYNAHFRIDIGVAGEEYLGIYSATVLTDPFPSGATLILDPATLTSACGMLGFSSLEGNISSTGTGPSKRYQPGYQIGESDKPTGGNLVAGGWAVVLPVTLYQPIMAERYLVGTIQTVPLTVTNSVDGTSPDESITNP